MPTRITALTEAQKERMGSFAQEWIDRGWRTEPLSEPEWAVWEQGARRCYELAGIPWPGVVVRVSSPLVGAFAAPIASVVIQRLRRGAVHGAVGDAVGDAVHGAVDGAVGDAVGGAVRGAVDGAVGGAVHGAVDGAVGDAVRSSWFYRLGGRLWPWWQSYIAYFRDVAELQLDSDLWDRSRAYEDAQSAGWWWPFREFVMVCDVPTELHLEQVQPAGWGSHRLHCDDGPAVGWADGWAIYAWHGTQVPKDLIVDGWSTDRILREPNAEVRRCAIERLGWDRFIADADLKQVGLTVRDPGNPGHTLSLFDVPERIYDEPVKVLLCTNATAERDGSRRRFGLTVPGSITDPVAAAGWTFGLDPSVYRQLERAT